MTDGEFVTVLIIDDNPVDRQIYRRMLETLSPSYRVHEAEDGARGIDASRALQPDCVLLDLRLIDQSGFEVLLALAGENAGAPLIPIIMLTGTTAPCLVDGAISFGAYSYLVKGRFGPEALAETIRAAIENHRILCRDDNVER